jgi:hypothetical protein
MPRSLELARPMTPGAAGFNFNEARRKLLEERQYIAALELQANDHLSLRVDTMHLKNRLRDIATNCRTSLAPPNHAGLNSTHIPGTHLPVQFQTYAVQPE